MGIFSRFAPVLGLCAFFSSVAPSARAGPPATREEVRAAIARWWDSTDSIDAKFDLMISDGGVERVSEEHHLAIASGGRYLLRSFRYTEDGRWEPLTNQCTDGVKTYRIQAVDEHPDVVDAMEIDNSKHTADSYFGPMNDILWILMPGGKRLHRQLDEGAEFAVERGEDGVDRYIVRFTFMSKSNLVRCELDPDHDWLPRAIDVGKSGDALRIRITKYTEEGGRFFPSEGKVIEKGWKGGEVERRLVVRSAAINQPLEPNLFKPRGVVAGTMAFDHQKGATSIQGGGIEARRAFEAKYLAPKAADSASVTSEPLTAERTPAEWSMVPILGASGALLVAALLVYRRRN